MKMMQGGEAGGNMPPAGTANVSPQENEGQKMQAGAKVQMAMTLLEQALVAFGSGSEEGQSVIKSLNSLGGKFGTDREKGRELIPSEIMNLVGDLPGRAGGSPMAPPGGGMSPAAMPPGMAGGGMPPLA